MSTTAPGPIRELRERIAGALKPLGVETYDVLPENVEAPAIAVGLPAMGTSSTAATALQAFSLIVTLVGERADFQDAQRRLDELQWEAWTTLRAIPGVWVTSAVPGPLEVAGQTFPSVAFTLEAPLPC